MQMFLLKGGGQISRYFINVEKGQIRPEIPFKKSVLRGGSVPSAKLVVCSKYFSFFNGGKWF